MHLNPFVFWQAGTPHSHIHTAPKQLLLKAGVLLIVL